MPEVPGVWMEHDVSLNFSDYKTASRYALHINAGYSARLAGKPRDAGDLPADKGQAWLHGWDVDDASMQELSP